MTLYIYIYIYIYTGWFKKMDSISYDYISWTIRICERSTYNLKEEVLCFQILPLEHSSRAQPCSSVSWEQNGYYAAQDFLRVSEDNVRWIQENFELSPRKSTRRASRKLGIPQPTVWRVLRLRLLFESNFLNQPFFLCIWVILFYI